MKTYKYTDVTNTVVHVIDEDGISRMSMLASALPADAVIEPADPANTDYAAYLAWLAEGNTPEPADPLPNPRIAEIKAELAANDARIIRALAEADAARIAAHNAAQEALRTELRNL